MDDGRVRTLVLPPARSEAGDSAPPLVLRLPSRQGGAGDFGSSHSDLLRRWLAAGERPEEVASATAVFRFRDEMDADLLGARDFLYTVDRRTALPVEYRLRRGGAAGRVVEHLEMSYGMPIPASVAAAPRPPAGATVVDAADDAAWGRLPGSGAPPPVGPNVVTAGPLTVAAEPAATDAAGAVLVRFRTWVGEVALRPPTGTVPLYPKFTTPSTRHSGQDTAPFCVDDRGRAYVWAQGWTAPRSASPDYEAVWLLAPAEPLPPGAPMPRALTLRGEASLMTPVAMPGAKGWKTERVLLNENFTWRIPLSARPAGLPSHDEEERRRNVASPPEAPIAEARAFHWMRVADSGGGGAAQAAGRRAAEWLERAIRSYGGNGARVPMLQLLLARQYDRLGERERAAELARRVLADTAPSNPNHRQAAELLEGLEKAAK